MEKFKLVFPNAYDEHIELYETHLEQKRWFRQQNKALYRDQEREKKELKEKVVKSIEDEISNTEQNLMKKLQKMKTNSKKSKLHNRLEGERVEFEAKLAVINEIK